MQKNLFGDTESVGLSVETAAKRLNVSTATIRNWIKTGYLRQLERGMIDRVSVDQFATEVVGSEKLILRANKSEKDTHDHNALSEWVKNILQADDWQILTEGYEASLSNAYRNKEGIYYTPEEVVEDMLKSLEIKEDSTFLDPCCGSGNFLLEAIHKGVNPDRVFGFDVDENAVAIARKRVFAETGFDPKDQILPLDFLENVYKITREEEERKYDFIFTNPPWGKKIRTQEKKKYAAIYEAGKSTDTTSLFYFAALQLLKPKGKLGFLVQEALFNISTFQDTRKSILSQKVLELTDYGKPFKGLLTKAYAFILEKNSDQNRTVQCFFPTSPDYTRAQETFTSNPKQILNFWVKSKEANVIDYVFSLPHTTLEENARWALGIVTGNNAKFCKAEPQEGYLPIFKGSDITTKGLKPPSNYIPDDFSRYQQVAPLSFYNAPTKLIYKFISSKLVFFYDTEQRFILNSANLMIPDEPKLGLSSKQLADLLSSEFMNWLFYALFNTHKILRGDLEQLPLHAGYFQKYSSFSEKSFIDFLGIKKEDNGTYGVKR